MQISGSTQNSAIRWQQEESKSLRQSVAARDNSPASPGVGQNVSAPSGATQGQYNASIDGLAGLLSTQGAEIFSNEYGTGSAHTCLGEQNVHRYHSRHRRGWPVTAAVVAQQMIDSVGSNGVLTVANVEKAENGSTSASASTSIDSNSYSDIAADFTKLSNGTGELTTAQLTNAIQHYIDTQNLYPNGFGSRTISQPA
jgi:hypothetical protein